MTCKICGRKTDWDSSVGYREFLVCNACEFALSRHDYKNKNTLTAMDFIFACGERVRELNEKKA